MTRTLRIHGDNIVECERALRMLAEALAESVDWRDSPLHAPVFRILGPGEGTLDVQLLPGYGRWEGDITGALRERGAPLAEAADAVITELTVHEGVQVERLIIAIEFCGALPAGNNAWQRCGRSYSYAISGVPYLYVSELGGYELSATRERKAPRLPNPLVPFAYAAQSELSETFALPVFTPSPSIDESFFSSYEEVFSWDQALYLLRAVVVGGSTTDAVAILMDKGVEIAKRIAASRRGIGVLRGNDWDELLARRGSDRLQFLVDKGIPWSKRVNIPITSTARSLLNALMTLCVGVGSSDMPFGIVPTEKRAALAALIDELYGVGGTSDAFRKWVKDSSEPLVVAFVAGFKPGGEDSRPDRGLLPLVRMSLGDEAAVLTIVYGPGTPGMWRRYRTDADGLARSNGLWQAVLGLSDAVLVDSQTSQGPESRLTGRQAHVPTIRDALKPVLMRAALTTPTYSEQDVDTVIKMMAAGAAEAIFEGLCNPPGGDWSGISLYDFDANTEYRWTSLPRVTSASGKRPDHVLQFSGFDVPVILSIESKDRVRDFEPHIGSRLERYVKDLIDVAPNIAKPTESRRWTHNKVRVHLNAVVLSAGAFILIGNRQTVIDAVYANELDMALAFTFPEPGRTKVLMVCRPEATVVAETLAEVAKRLGHRIEIEIHAL